MFIKKYLKWISTALVLTGILLTNLNIYPINIYFHGLGVVGWTVAGFLSKDKACLLYTSPSPRDVEESRMPSSA